MKKLMLSIVLALFMSTTFATSKVVDPIVSFPKTAKELSKLLGPTQFDEELKSGEALKEELLVKVRITLNKKREIVVLQVDSVNEVMESYIKYKLNYKKIASDELKYGVEYFFDVKFKLE